MLDFFGGHALVNMVIGAFGATMTAFCANKMGLLKGFLNVSTDKVNQYFQNRWGVAVPDSVHTWEHSAIEYACAWMEKYALSKLFWRTLAWDVYNKNPARLVALKEQIEKMDAKDFAEGIYPEDVKVVVNEAKFIGVKKVVEAKALSYSPRISIDSQIAATATALKVNFPIDGEVKSTNATATKEDILKTFESLLVASKKRQEALK